MSRQLFRAGGPLKMKKSGNDKYTGTVTLNVGADGMVGRACSDDNCVPGYFRVKFGTGITIQQAQCYCPYCATAAPPNSFFTPAQVDYIKASVFEELKPTFHQMLRDAFKVDSRGRRSFGDFVTLQLSDPPRPKAVTRPVEEELRRDLTCPHCGLVHAVFGFAVTCPDCGNDIFLTHVHEELAVVNKILAAVPDRAKALGQRAAARDVENALEDVVSIFEFVMKLVTRRVLARQGMSESEIEGAFKKVGNKYQNAVSGSEMYKSLTGGELFAALASSEFEFFKSTFAKRHPITHNLGVVDRKYLERATSNALEGQELRVTAEEILQAIGLAERVFADVYKSFATSVPPTVLTPAAPPAPMETKPASPDNPLEGLSPAAVQAAEYLIRQSEHGLDRDPTRELPELATALGLGTDACRAACEELLARGWIEEDDELINGEWRIAPKPSLFQALDRVWLATDVIVDAVALAEHLLENADTGLAIPAFAETLAWLPRRVNPALQYLAEHEAVELGSYAHPYFAHWMHENENTREFLVSHKAQG